MLKGELSEVVELLAEVVAGIQGVGSARSLAVESRDHYDSHRAEFTCSGHDLAHRFVERRLDRRVFGQDEAVESSADGRDLDVTSDEGVTDLIDAGRKVPSVRLETTHLQVFHEIQLLAQILSRGDPFLKRELQLKTWHALLLVQCSGTSRQHGGRGQGS